MAEDLSLLLNATWLARFNAQVQRDYELSGATACMPVLEINTLTGVQEAFARSVLELERRHLLTNLLYRIDLTEKQIAEAARLQPGQPMPMVLAELMIKRILQKVVLKEHYK